MENGQASTAAKLPEAQGKGPNQSGGAWLSTLTRRELQVLTLVVQGRRTREIANQLDLSERTIEVYRSHLRMKTGAKSLVELATRAIQNGLLKC